MKKLLKTLALAAMMLSAPAAMSAAPVGKPGTFTVGDKTFLLNGEPFIVKAAEVHYPRIPRPYWEHRIQMCKALGMNAVCIYIFWNIHEQREGQFDFTGNNDVAEFCRLAQKNGMYVIVRPGPY
ncbi:MAG: beta-galactosidase, partial [Prevotella sp.]|nr:beta-galactosidase [Prevotella sp.]